MYKIIDPIFDYNGWPLSPVCLRQIQELIDKKEFETLNAIEFGSGFSTRFLKEFKETNNIPGVYDVFDACLEYADLSAKIKELKNYDPAFFGQGFNFYDLDDSDFHSNEYDLCVLDGHLGPGRSAAFHFIMNRMKEGSLMVIDDYDHFPFEQNFLLFFPNSKLLIRNWEEKISERWVIYEVKR